MALFGSGRDASLIRSLSKELINRYVDTEVEYFKLSLENTNENLYGESSEKIFFRPVRLSCLVQRDEKVTSADDLGVDYNRTALFSFLRDSLVDINVYMSPGDIIRWNMEYFEIDQVENNQYWAGKNPDTHLGTIYAETPEFGYNTSVLVQAHKTRLSKLNIQEFRTGNNINRYVPKNL